MVRKLSALLMVVAFVGLGCGDDAGSGGSGGTSGTGGTSGSGGTGGTGGSGGIDAPMIDGSGTDGLPADAQGLSCTDYCNCMLSASHCLGSSGGYTAGQMSQCLTNCASFTPAQLECRTAHCGLAPDNTSVHCQHAIGQGAGVPAACQ